MTSGEANRSSYEVVSKRLIFLDFGQAKHANAEANTYHLLRLR